MKSKFNQLFNSIMKNNEYLLVENIQDILIKSNNLIYETNNILKCPNNVIQSVKNVINKLLIEKKFNSSEKIFINDVFQFNELENIKDIELIETIQNLFKNHNTAFFNVKINGTQDYWFDKKGEYELPIGFTENLIEDSTLHYEYPRIKPLIINNQQLNMFIKNYQNDIKFLKNIYEKQQKALEIFKEHILNFNDFGTIIIYPFNYTQDDLNVDLPTLDEAIEHECQHLYIFLLSLAKTCIYLGIHFSNNLQKSALTYQLKEKEFITLTGSYCNILIRIFKKINEPKNVINFIKAVIELSIYDQASQDQRYIDALNASLQFSKIKEFYKAIFNDSKYGIYSKKLVDNKIVKTNVIDISPNKKFQTLVKWTLKNFEKNL